ncbi:MAG: hypothetical protein AB1697_03345, partial [Pseudomonadota bacterium]
VSTRIAMIGILLSRSHGVRPAARQTFLPAAQNGIYRKNDTQLEILPMKSLQSQMSSGVAYYEGELYNVVRQGRGVPAVPLVLVGIEA